MGSAKLWYKTNSWRILGKKEKSKLINVFACFFLHPFVLSTVWLCNARIHWNIQRTINLIVEVSLKNSSNNSTYTSLGAGHKMESPTLFPFNLAFDGFRTSRHKLTRMHILERMEKKNIRSFSSSFVDYQFMFQLTWISHSRHFSPGDCDFYQAVQTWHIMFYIHFSL